MAKVWEYYSDLHVFGTLREYDDTIAKEVTFSSPGAKYYRHYGPPGPSNGRFMKSIDLSPSEYHWASNERKAASSANYYKAVAAVNGFGELGGEITGFANPFGPVEFGILAAGEALAGWASTNGTSSTRDLTVPPGWTDVLNCGLPRQRVWGVGDTASCLVVRNYAQEGGYTTGTFGGLAARFCYFTEANPSVVNSQTFRRNGGLRWVTPFTNFRMPYKPALQPGSGLKGMPAWNTGLMVDTAEYGGSPRRGRIKLYQVPLEGQFKMGGPNNRPPVTTPGGVHDQLPPGRKVREKKFQYKGGKAGEVYGALTEIQDVVNCLYRSIPQGTHGKHGVVHGVAGALGGERPGLYDKVKYVNNNSDRIDWWKSIKCIVANEVTDRAVGGLSKAGSTAWRRAVDAGIAPASMRAPGLSRYATRDLNSYGSLRMR